MERREHRLFFSKQEVKEKAIRQKFLEAEQQEIFVTVYEDMVKQMSPFYYLERVEQQGWVVMTLGEEIDKLQQTYLLEEEYLKAYSLDCLGMEFLMKFYDCLKEDLAKEGFYIKQWLYPGEHLVLEEISEIFQQVKPKGVTYNAAFAMKPQKSVAMKIILTDRIEDESCGICTHCSNTTCTLRKE